jgi:hypothetical protein
VPSVVFYISGHGFGHASRETEVIHALAALRPDWPIVLRTAVSPSLLSRSLTVPFTLLEGPCDTGIVQRDSVTHDDDATAEAAIRFHATWDARADEECRRLARHAPRVIVGDIPPLAFEVAARLQVPSVAIANFTWDWIYEWYPPLRDAPGLLEQIRGAYGKATLALRLPFAPAFDQFSRVEDLPLVARVSRQPRHVTRHALGIPRDRRVALLSFGGYGLQRLNVAGLDCLDDWTVLLTDRLASTVTPSPHVVFVDESRLTAEFRYEDLVAASDVVVTKPGYGVLSECAAAGTALLYTSRGHFREYDLMVQEMPRLLRSRFLSQEALFAGRWKEALEALLTQPDPPMRADITGAARAAARIAGEAERATSGR